MSQEETTRWMDSLLRPNGNLDEGLERLAKIEQEHKELVEIISTLFRHPMVSDVRRCRNCGVPVVHMEHLKLDEAKELEARVYKLLNINMNWEEQEDGP